MLGLVLALTVAAPKPHFDGRFDRFCSRSGDGRNSRGLLCNDFAFFEAFPANGVGAPAECSTGTVTGAKGEALTFTRASSGYCTKQDGTLVLLSTNQPRIMSGAINDAWLGILVEPARSNGLSSPSDLANVAWTKTSMTCTRNATGPDSVANSASTCTASAGNGQVTQAVAAGTGITSVYIKRSVGTGSVLVTADNFATTTDVGSAISSSRWKRLVPYEAPGCAGGDCIVVPNFKHYSAAAQTVGLRLGTNGDAVLLWTFQEENLSGSDISTGTFTATSPMNENTGARAVDRASFAPLSSTAIASASVRYQFTGGQPTISIPLTISNGTDGLLLEGSNGSTKDQRLQCNRFVSAVSTLAGGTTPMPFSGRTWLEQTCTSVSAGVVTSLARGRPDITATSGSANIVATKIQVGGYDLATAYEMGSVFKHICADPDISRCGYVSGGTGGSPVAWIGDSITYGMAGSPSTGTRPPNSLETLLRSSGATTNDRAVYNLGVGGYRTDQCLQTWRQYVRGKGFSTLILLCGVNSAIQGIPATSALAWADLQTILDEARADGLKVIPMTILPFGNNVNWNASRQTYITDINTSITNYCTANSLTTCLDEYTAFLGVSPAMNAAYDSGDGLHPNPTGSDKLAADANTKAP